jgi:hypothetical protein
MKCLAAVLLGSLVFLSTPSAALRAQAPLLLQPIDSGVLVRMRLATGESVRGRLLARLDPGSERVIYCRYPGNPCTDSTAAGVRVQPMAGVLGLEVGAGSRAVPGALLGALAGLGGALLGDALLASLCDTPPCRHALVIPLVIGGAVLGALRGSADIVWHPAP